ncbi:hypothetical protein LCGC14_2468120 [marine sediment metagenome]|uniref:Uncharacterized protein n=1 Tax=marine sediment metagenome TaxID=412755 RepID=A0A0F9BBT4_9ZZZZ
MRDTEQVRREIRNNGYLSALQIMLRVSRSNPKIDKKGMDSILNSIVCKDIHKIEYTNSYVSALKLKDLYYYNPTKKKPQRKKRRSAKKA